MYRQLSDDRYVHSVVFKDMEEAHAAMHAVQEAGISQEQLDLIVQHEGEPVQAVPKLGGDGKRGLFLGLLSGAFVGLLMSLLFAKLGLLSGFFDQTPIFGLFGGMMIGGLGGGLYGTGLRAAPLRSAKPLPPEGNCLVTAKTTDLTTIRQVEWIFRKHRALSAIN